MRPVSGDTEKHQLLPGLVSSGRSLVYASTRRKAEEMAETLVSAGLKAAAYHAGLSDGERTRVQDAFASGSLAIVCATNAFGMGIDRPDVGTVVHVDIPGSLEAYYQEIGRAGRDGRDATAILLWNYADVKTREFLIERGRDEASDRFEPLDSADAERRRQLEIKKLRRMVAYADTSACLRATILRYFGDPAAGGSCGRCSNCERLAPVDEASLLMVRKVLSGVARAGERFGRRKIAADAGRRHGRTAAGTHRALDDRAAARRAGEDGRALDRRRVWCRSADGVGRRIPHVAPDTART